MTTQPANIPANKKTARSHVSYVNGLFFVCFNRPSRHDQSAFSGDRMPGHAEACHPNGPYDGVRVEACALSVACVDHRSSRRINGSILNDVRTDSCQTERIPVIFLTFGKNKVDSRCRCRALYGDIELPSTPQALSLPHHGYGYTCLLCCGMVNIEEIPKTV